MKRLLSILLAAVLMFGITGCVKPETGEIESVKLLYNGTPVQDGKMTLNLARKTIAFTVEVKKTGSRKSDVVLTSDNTAVADADGLVVILYSVGTATITAVSSEDDTKSDSIELTIEPVVPAVNSVTLRHPDGTQFADKEKDVNIENGTFTFRADVNTKGSALKAVTLSSSDTSVATVDGLTATLKKTGVTYITAVSDANSTKTDKIKLTVYDTAKHALNITGGVAKNINNETVTTASYGDVITLFPDTAAEGTEFVTWNVQGGKFRVINNTFVFKGYDTTVAAVYGYKNTLENLSIDFTKSAGAYKVTRLDNNRHDIDYDGIEYNNYGSTKAELNFPASENYNRFAITVQNRNARNTTARLDVRSIYTGSTNANNLNGSNGTRIDLAPFETKTAVAVYSPKEVKSLNLFIDSIGAVVAGEGNSRSGGISISNMTFFAVNEIASVSINKIGDNAVSGGYVGILRESADVTLAADVAVRVIGTPSNAVTLSSSNPSVAEIDGNNIVFKNTGVAEITAASTVSPSIKDTVTVIVHDGVAKAITVENGTAKNSLGDTVTQGVYGDVITLEPGAAPAGQIFVRWAITEGRATVGSDNKFVFWGAPVTLKPVYGYERTQSLDTAVFEEPPRYTMSKANGVFTISYTNIVGNSSDNIKSAINYPQSAECNTFAVTFHNTNNFDIRMMVRLRSEHRPSGDQTGLNIVDSGTRTIPANGSLTLTVTYTPQEVKSIWFYVDSQWGTSDARTGTVIISNMAFFTA